MSSKEQYNNNQVEVKNESRVKSHMNLIFIAISFGLAIYFVCVSVLILNNTNKPCIEINKQVNSYERLLDVLDSGKKLRIVMDYNKMTFNDTGNIFYGIDEKTGFDLDDYQYFGPWTVNNPQPYLITSFNKFVVHPTLGPIYNYGKLRIYKDESYMLLSYFIRPDTFDTIVVKSLNGTFDNGGLAIFTLTP